MVVHPTMKFKFCFSYVLLLTFTAVNEVTYVIGFTCDRLLDVVCFRVMVTGYGCGEVSFFVDGTSWVRFTRPESRCWFVRQFFYVWMICEFLGL